MSKFKVGDTVRRTGGIGYQVMPDSIHVVSAVGASGLDLEGIPRERANLYNYDSGNFELVQAVTPEQPVLTPQEVFTAILEGVPLEYRTFSGSNWHILAYPENTSMSSFKVAEFRKKAQTVNLSGTVPKPVPYDLIDVTDKVYTLYLSTMQVAVVNGRYAQIYGLYWRTQVEAEQARDVLSQCFSTVPVLD